MAVKGSKFTHMRVIPHSPRDAFLRALALVVSFPVVFFAGVYWVQQKQHSLEESVDQEHQKVVAGLSQELTGLRTSIEVDRQSMEDLRQLVMTQKAQLNASERDLRVYKDLLSPGAKSNPMGISLGVFTVVPVKELGHFNYSLTVQKLATKEADFSGFLEFRIIGQQAGKSLQLSLYQVSSQVTEPSIPVTFKYFQTLEGELSLPQDFVPQTVELVVKSEEKKSIIATELDWPMSSFKPK